MALKKASERKVEGDYIDFKELAKEGPAVVFSVLEIEELTEFTNGSIRPVRAEVIILTGSKAGEVYPNERIINAGIINKLTEVGDQVVGRVRPYGARKNPGLEDEQDGDVELALAALEKAKNGGAAKAKTEAAKVPAGVGASVVGDANADDSEPDF